MRTWCRDLYITGLISKNKNKNRNQDKNNTKQKQIQKNKAILGVCLAGMKRCSCAEACSPSFSLIMLHCGGSSGLGCEIPLPIGTEMCVCVSRVVGYSSVVMRGRIPLYWEIRI